MLLMMLIAWLPWILLGGAALFLGLRAVRALERRGTPTVDLATLSERLQTLEDTVAEQGESLRRVAEGQEFTQRLLVERTSSDTKPAKNSPAI